MKLLFLIAATVAFFSCTSSSNNEITSNTQQAEAPKVVKPSHEPIYISTFTFAKKDGKQLENKFKVDILTSDYLDIDLKSMGGGAGHMATKDLKPILDPDNYTSISITIATKDNKPVYFQSPGEFLNFMSGHGYDMVDQQKNKYSITYTFKKK